MSEDVERRLRAALSARADQVTADSLRVADLIPAPVRRRQTIWALLLRPVPLGALAAVLLVTVLVGLTLRPGPPDPPQNVATLDGVSFALPDGWAFRPMVEGIGCLQPVDAEPTGDSCTPNGVEIRVGTFVGWPQNSLDRDDGWSVNPEECSASGAPDPLAQVTANRLTAQQSPTVGGHAAAYRVWSVSCGTWRFTVRLWWVPDASVTVYTRGLDSRHDGVVEELVNGIRLPGSG